MGMYSNDELNQIAADGYEQDDIDAYWGEDHGISLVTQILPKFEIVRIDALYDDRDAFYGTRAVNTGRTFFNAALAHKIAGRLDEFDCAHGGDGGYEVREIGSNRRMTAPHVWPPVIDDFCPF